MAKEFNRYSGKDMMAENFAATPPLEALKILISMAAQDKRKVIMIADVSRAFFEAAAEREVCVELPSEHWINGIKVCSLSPESDWTALEGTGVRF